MPDITVLWANLRLAIYEKEKQARKVAKFLYWEEGVNGNPIIKPVPK